MQQISLFNLCWKSFEDIHAYLGLTLIHCKMISTDKHHIKQQIIELFSDEKKRKKSVFYKYIYEKCIDQRDANYYYTFEDFWNLDFFKNSSDSFLNVKFFERTFFESAMAE